LGWRWRIWERAHCSLFAAGKWAQRADVRHAAGSPAKKLALAGIGDVASATINVAASETLIRSFAKSRRTVDRSPNGSSKSPSSAATSPCERGE
jgi:hypothetical protein